MYSIVYTGQFKKSLKLCVKRGLDATLLAKAVDILQKNGSLPDSYKPHKLKVNMSVVGNVTFSQTGY